MLIRHRLHDLASLNAPLHLAIGVFDGVHLGHQHVIHHAVTAATTHGGLAGVLTFHPHPACVVANRKNPAGMLASLEHKTEMVARCGVQVFISLHFDATLAKMEASEFLDHLLAVPLRTLAVGHDWRFGCGRKGDVTMLQSRSRAAGVTLAAVPMVTVDGERVSSTRIREAIRHGDLATAARLLGRPYTLSGKVLHGRELGRQLGFPTANVDITGLLTPPAGVWAVRASIDGAPALPGVANLGTRPTVDDSHHPSLEVHLLDFSANLYDRRLAVEFVQFLRAERKFDSLDALRSQIASDVSHARQVLAIPG